tara:strand:- start:603 stop:803 length:201 start_codon:yes stop_codon:yes gene_type:complete
MQFHLIHNVGDIKTYKAFIYMGEEMYEFESDTLCQVLQLVDYFKRNHELRKHLISKAESLKHVFRD